MSVLEWKGSESGQIGDPPSVGGTILLIWSLHHYALPLPVPLSLCLPCFPLFLNRVFYHINPKHNIDCEIAEVVREWLFADHIIPSLFCFIFYVCVKTLKQSN